MEIKDLQPKQGNVEVVAEVVEKDEVREFEKFGKTGKVCNAKIKDATGTIILTLWNEQVDQIKVGDTVKVENGYVNEWQGDMQLTSGKFGKLEVVEKTEASAVKSEEMQSDQGEHILTEDEKTEEESLDEDFKEPSVEESATDDEVKIEEEEIQ